MIKGNKSGIVLVLDKDLEFAQLKNNIADKFKETAKFLGNANMAISFEGRELSTEEQKEERVAEMDSHSGQFYKGNLRSGQVLEVETSVVVIGDVNIGAKVVSKGNIIILGNLKGNAFAGAGGNKNSFVLALGMQPIQIRIADFIARAPDNQEKGFFKEKASLFGRKKDKKKPELDKQISQEMKIAFVEDETIMIQPLTKDVLNEINL